MPPETPTAAASAPADGRAGRRLRWIGVAVALVAAAIVVNGLLERRAQSNILRERADALAVPTVVVRRPAAAGNATPLELPARIEAWAQAPIYARVSGYLKRWTADIGTQVQAGQLLAEIETPDLDQQLLQARAELNTAQANAELAAATAKRWEQLQPTGVVTKQGVDEKLGDANAKQSVVRALQANLERVQTLKQFTRITAPFAGVVTARNTDVGALINAGGAAGSELFVVSDTRRVRVYIGVPQSYAALIQPDIAVRLRVPERPGKTYEAKLVSSARAINSAGSMQVQLAVDNASGELLPGSFATVTFDLPRSAGTLAVPPGALIFNKSGLSIATVDDNNKVVLKPVTVARDLGTVIELSGGLLPTDRIIESPPEGLQNGDEVKVAASAVPGSGKVEP